MRIVIDLQGMQTESRFRGIGRYTLSLTQAIIRNAHKHEIILVLNAAFPQSAVEIRETFESLLPQNQIKVFDPPYNIAEQLAGNSWRIRSAEKIRENFIQKLKPDMVLVTSLFEGYIDDAVTSISKSTYENNTAVILYDLIPLLNPAEYLPMSIQKEYYNRKIASLKNAGLLLSISNYSRLSAIESLSFEQERIVNISTAADNFFETKTFTPAEIETFFNKYKITKNIVLYVSGGFDNRKNIDGLLQAYITLPSNLRKKHQLVIASKIDDTKRYHINKLCKQHGFMDNEIIITNYISNDDLLKFYNLTTLFVFPSLCEGFGLPVLEAMSCGAPVIAADNTSLPEVIGYQNALFSASDPNDIAAKMQEALTNETFRQQLKTQGSEQAKKFSWDVTAKTAIQALETYYTNLKSCKKENQTICNSAKTRLAFISPFPPEKTGIADYSAELLTALIRHYEITLISDQNKLNLPSTLSTLQLHTSEWFTKNFISFDRVLYHIGNSPFHTHMLDLMSSHPGVLVLHDFYLSGMLAYEELNEIFPQIWTNSLFYSHGYIALNDRFKNTGIEYTKNKYPCNLEVLQNAKRVIVHSNYSKKLTDSWYGANASKDWQIIPLLRIPPVDSDRLTARKTLGIDPNDLLICSFGLIDPTKQSLRLLQAFLKSRLHTDIRCKLIFVGLNHGGDYGIEMVNLSQTGLHKNNIRITGWVEKEIYDQYLRAADVGVQLRTMSRGETSAAVLDCLNYGLPTIINANGSMAEFPSDVVYMLPDEFTEKDLTIALESLFLDTEKFKQLSRNANIYIKNHHPDICAQQYVEVIESAYNHHDQHDLINEIGNSCTSTPPQEMLAVAQAISNSYKPIPSLKQLLIDVTTISKNDLKTGIERVVRAQMLELIMNPPKGYRIEPIFLSNEGGTWHYRYARQYTLQTLGITHLKLPDLPIDIYADDIFYAADFSPYEITEAAKEGLFTHWKAIGVHINILIYDLLPILHPEFFPLGSDNTHRSWLQEITHFADHIIGISKSVRDGLYEWLEQNWASRTTPLKLSACLLGADISASLPTFGLPNLEANIFKKLEDKTSFLMVGTIEPRKGHLQVITAFEKLWKENDNSILIIVGKEGWRQLPTNQRRTIPNIINKIKKHHELGKRLFWISEASDEFLQTLYSKCICLLAASEGEGFGLPLIEAAHHKLPIIARDIPVFKEVAGEHAYYFSGLETNDLYKALKEWLNLYVQHKAPSSENMCWKSWKNNTDELIDILLNKKCDRVWSPATVREKALNQHLDLIHSARIDMVKTLLPKGDHILDLGGANSPLYKMGYAHTFKKLTLIDLPIDQRHEYYKDIVVDTNACGEVILRYSDMTKLLDIDDGSIDFVWSGQSIEHVPYEDGKRMCQEVFRVLKNGGAFCLDTPNRLLTKVHTHSSGGGFIHPEHHIEYIPDQLRQILIDAGFKIKKALGICEMPETIITKKFNYSDFIFGKKITENINNAYIQFFHCEKV